MIPQDLLGDSYIAFADEHSTGGVSEHIGSPEAFRHKLFLPAPEFEQLGDELLDGHIPVLGRGEAIAIPEGQHVVVHASEGQARIPEAHGYAGTQQSHDLQLVPARDEHAWVQVVPRNDQGNRLHHRQNSRGPSKMKRFPSKEEVSNSAAVFPRGSRQMNLEPRPNSLSTSMWPSSSSTRALTTERPSPCPLWALNGPTSSCRKRSKISSRSDSLKPKPWSSTSMTS
eukprot:TRINITY_DN14625_c0_g1_i3.p2 TRINITY_DN14625_c0_g1~~TRINITY_DN14625_c0_g1_i3.p2  ORF type:complete len:227 (-),score=-32.06 TRINITY_DN14625_c0_g1_i3:239-919(-)